MADDADAADTQLTDNPNHAELPIDDDDIESSSAAVDVDGDKTQDGNHAVCTSRPSSHVRLGVAFGLLVVTGLAATTAWLGVRCADEHRDQQQRVLFLQAGRQAALNLTTISHTEADADVQRILDSSTGEFHDDLQNRSQPFIEAIKQAQSQTEGTITEAGLESVADDGAQVLVAVAVKTTNAGAEDQQPRQWRMRIGVQKVDGAAEIAKVAFVP